MIKVFTLNKNGKIELTEKELKQLLDDSYWEGYRNGQGTTWTYTSPSICSPYIYTTTYNGTTGSITLTSATSANTDDICINNFTTGTTTSNIAVNQ